MFGRKTKKSGSRRFLVSDSGSKSQSQSSRSGKNSLDEPWEDVMDSEDALFKTKGDELVQLRAKIYHLQEENTTLRENLKEMELHITTMNVEALNSENEALKAKLRTLEEKQKWFDGLSMPSAVVPIGDEEKSVDSDSTDESVHNRRASDCPSPAVQESSSLPQSPFRSLSYQTSIADSSKVEAAYLVSADENASADELRREIHQLGQELAKAKISWALAESEHIHVKAKYKKLERINSQYLLRIEDMENELKEWRMRLAEANRRVLEVEGDREGLTEQIKRADLQLLDMRSQLTFALRFRLEH